ncbi:hypothetical protein LT679_00540 [Mucilaginibacter roseus]|uniref:Uncharacterized protein n=1 Tax=Mucilaginibacter roseus TaxID=1528868 RepID=A0ABS8U0N1_9SPHI|nr:hypothetical protein [Mucilaginibacter roseus]MCD8739073.1 hypothetical protein [Mucilaginibacter roseus]
MLNAISWQQYLTVILLSTIAWYTYVGLRYYRTELAALLKIKPGRSTATPPVAARHQNVMGAVRPDVGTSLHAAEELVFSAGQPDEIEDQTIPRGPSDDLLDEAKVLVDAFSGNDNKTEFLGLLQLLLGKYEVLSDEISLPALIPELSDYAKDRLPFPIKQGEWPITF